MKQSLIYMIDILHTNIIRYLQYIHIDSDMMIHTKDDIDNIIHNIMYVLKIVRCKIYSKIHTSHMYQHEYNTINTICNTHISSLSHILHRIRTLKPI